MTALKCDRCKKYYDYYESTEMNKNGNTIGIHYTNANGDVVRNRYFDLCPTCMKKLITFIEGGATDDEQ